MQNPNNKSRLRDCFEFAAGALTFGAEKLLEGTAIAADYVKRQWNNHEAEREEIRKKLLQYKDKFLKKMQESGQKEADFDRIVRSLETLTKEELDALKAILDEATK